MLAVIGGTGFYQIDGLEIAERREVKTPFGEPSAPLTFAKGGGGEDDDISSAPRRPSSISSVRS